MLLSGRSLALQCQWNCCPRYPTQVRPFSYVAARHGDRVFLNLDFLDRFFRAIPVWMRGSKKFVLVCQNSDREFNRGYLERLRPYALHIYSINCVIQDPMVTTLPIGFGDWSIDHLPLHPKDPLDRTIEIYAAFTTATNPKVREPCKESLLKDPRVTWKMSASCRAEFYDLVRQSKYVACPEGEGHDTHRIYESIYFGAVPIVKSPSVLAHLYEGWPIRWVPDWDHIELDWEADQSRLREWINRNPDWATRSYLTKP